MKIPRKRCLAGGLLLGVIVTYFFGYEWENQWNIRSGKQRQVSKVFGIAFNAGSPSSTPLSEWRNIKDSGADWVKIASGPNHGALVHWTYPYVFNHLRMMDWVIKDPQHRRDYAGWILEALGRGNSLREVVRHCKDVEEVVFDFGIDFEEEGLSLSELERVWRDPRKAQQDVGERPDTARKVPGDF